MRRKYLGASVLLVFGILMILSADSKPQEDQRETFSAMAYLPSITEVRMVAPSANRNVTIYIESYSPDEDAQRLEQALLSGGQDALVKAMERMATIGKVELTGRGGFFDLKFIRSKPMDGGGRRIIAACDRPIQFLESYEADGSVDYKIGIVEFDLKEKIEQGGKKIEEGEGALIYAAKIKIIEDKKIEIENYGVEPAKLMGIRKL